MKLIGKRILASLLSVVMLLAVVPVMGLGITASAAETYSGKCGENLTWSFDPVTGELVIDGVGVMYDYDFDDDRPWEDYPHKIETVTIGDEVTTIGLRAFYYCVNLTSVTIGNSITKIGEAVFSGCVNLTSVTIGNSVTVIGDCAFDSCQSLTSITIPNNVQTIGNYAFRDCKSLTSITLPDSVTVIGDYAFKNCISLANVIIGNSVTSIGNHAFDSCYSLPGVAIPDSVTTIGDYAFYECAGFINIIIPDSVIIIGDYAFYWCSYLTSVTIGSGVTSIGDYAFAWCFSLADVEIPESVTTIGEGAFDDCANLTDIIIPESVTTIGKYLFRNCYDLTSIEVDADNEYYSSDSFGVLYNKTKTDLIQYPVGNERTKFIIPDSVNTISDYAFSGCNLANIMIPDSVAVIEKNAFAQCNLTNITIPDSVTIIGENAFDSCYNLTNIVVDTDNQHYSSDSFGVLYNKAKTDLIQYPIGNERTEFTIPDSVITVADSSFFMNYSIESITIPDSVTTIGNNAFSDCIYLTNLTIPDSVTKIGEYAFYECMNLTSITIPESVTTIEEWTFGGCDSLTSVTIPDSITKIEYAAFAWCYSLTDVYYFGTEEDWDEVEIYEGNEDLLDATIHFIGESEHTHSYSSSVTKEATCKETGVITYTCSCGDTYTEVIPMKEHNMVHDITLSTCKVAGMEYDFCSGCGETFNVKTLPLNAHTWGEWEVTTPPTASNEGISTRVCSVCGEKETKSIQKLGVMKDEKTGIEIEFDDEYGSGVEIKVEEVFDGDSFKIIENVCGNNNSEIYDISTIKNGVKVQPDGKVKVRIPVPAGFETTNILVFYIDSTNGTATNIPANIVEGYVEFETDHFSYYAIVEKLGKVNSVSINDISMNYKDSAAITPTINADAGVKYTVSYSSSNNDVVSVDANGRVTTNGTGSATITVTVTDEYGNTVTDTNNVNVSYKWWQWIIVIVLFGWIWY